MVPSSSPEKTVNNECLAEDWRQWEKLRKSANNPDCVKQVSLLCNGPWTEWQIVPGEDCYYERSRHILYKAGRRAKLLLCDEEVAERSCDEVPITPKRLHHTKLSTLSSKRPPVRTRPRPFQASRPTTVFRTTRSMQSNKVIILPDTTPRKRISSTTADNDVSPSLPAGIQLVKSDGLAGGAVAGICLGVILLAALLALIAFLVKRRRQNKKSDYYSDPNLGDMNSSTRGNTYQEISSLDSRRSYESNISLDSGIFSKFPNELSLGQAADCHPYQRLKSGSNQKYHHMPENKQSDTGCTTTGYDQSGKSKVNPDEPKSGLSKVEANNSCITRNNTGYDSPRVDDNQAGGLCPNQQANQRNVSAEVDGNVSAASTCHDYYVLEEAAGNGLPSREEITMSNSKETASLDDRNYYILEPEVEDGAGVLQQDDTDYCSLVERTESTSPKYDVLRKANVQGQGTNKPILEDNVINCEPKPGVESVSVKHGGDSDEYDDIPIKTQISTNNNI